MKKKVNRHRSTRKGKYIVTHYIINDIHGHNSGNITNVIATSGRDNIDVTPQYHSSPQQLSVNVEKTDGHAETSNNQTAGAPKQHQTTINHDNSCLFDYLSSAVPFIAFTAAALVVSSIIKKRA